MNSEYIKSIEARIKKYEHYYVDYSLIVEMLSFGKNTKCDEIVVWEYILLKLVEDRKL